MSVCNVKFSLQMLQQGLKFDFFGAAAVQMVFFHFLVIPPLVAMDLCSRSNFT